MSRGGMPMFADCIEEKVHPATWAVVGFKKDLVGMKVSQRGTAFAVDVHGHLITCWHVTYMDQDHTEEPDQIEVVQPAITVGKRFRATVVARDKDRDLAVLKIEDAKLRTKGLPLHAGDRLPWGKSCCAFGHPLGVAGKDSLRIFTRAAAGVLSMPYSGPRFEGTKPIQMYEVDFFAHGGLSGGPLFTDNGCAFGVVSGSLVLQNKDGTQASRSNLSIAIDVAEAIEFLKSLNINPQLVGHVGGDVVAKKAQSHGSSKKRRRKR